ncbi:MAG: glycosyltransferase [Pseudomonadota bacterium]|jgi:rhamnosyltransferase
MRTAESLNQALSQAAIIIPTKNAGAVFVEVLQAVREQEGWSGRCIVIDSGSVDDTPSIALSYGCELIQIKTEEFDHGGTRQYGVDMSNPLPFIIFLTQDAILATKDALLHLISGFDDPEVGACFGRQVPRKGANLIEYHARLFNYPEQSRTTSLDDAKSMGIKAAFLSNSFAAYRRAALESAGGFPMEVIFGEDMLTAAKMLNRGWKISYRAQAQVFHSHDYSFMVEFKRYFDMGVMHSRERSHLEFLGKTNREGWKFVRSENLWLARRAPWLIPVAWLRNVIKLAGYRLGKLERSIPSRIKSRLSMNKTFWNRTLDRDAP